MFEIIEIPINKKRMPHSKKVDMLSFDGDYIRTFDSITEASRETYTVRSGIMNVLKGTQKVAGGYKWRHSTKITSI